MDKYLRQFAPFVALIVAAALVVIADPGDSGGTGGSEETEVAGVSARRTTTTTGVPAAAADMPTDATLATSDVAPFAPISSGSSSSSSFSTSSFSSGSASSSSSDFATPTTVPVSTFTPLTAPPTADESPATTVPVASGSDFYLFDALPSSAACSAGGDAAKPLSLAPAYQQAIHSSEPAFPDLPGGMTPNRSDPEAERYFYRAHGLMTNAAVSVTDTTTGATRILSQRPDWERLDGMVWSTAAKTILVGENMKVSEKKDAAAPNAKGGHVYEINPTTGFPTLRAALGSKAHRGMSFDHLGNLYSVSASSPGYVYRFVPKGIGANLYSTGELSALLVHPNGESNWLLLSGAAALDDTDEAARLAGATQFLSPEDAEVMIITAASGAKRSQLFVAEQGANRVVTVVLRGTDNTAFTSVYVAPGVNAPDDFRAPSKLAVDVTYNVYIAERNGGDSLSSKTLGDDIWVAPANPASAIQSLPVGRMASLTDCDAEPAGLTFDLTTSRMYVNLKHRGGDGRDMTLQITKSGGL